MPESNPKIPLTLAAETTNIGSELAVESSSDPVSPTVTETDVDTAVVAVPSPPPMKEEKLILQQIL